MSRTRQQVLDALADAAALRPFTDGQSGDSATWRDVLFTASGGGWVLSREADADRQLLTALADELALVDAHADTLPARLHTSWLEDILGIPRLPVVPDRVIASATVEPKLAPAVVPADTRLRGGKDDYGNERRYRTLDSLTAHGAVLVGVRALVPGGPALGSPGLALSAPDFPMTPPASEDEAKLGTPPAPHIMRISSRSLGFAEGDMNVRLFFDGVDLNFLFSLRSNALWRYPLADGTMSPLTPGEGVGANITFLMTGGCVDPAGGEPWIECVINPELAWPEEVAFTQLRVQTWRTGIAPDSAFVNAGEIDPSKDFEPFGVTAGQGDAFYVRSDEALSKELNSLTIHATQLAAAEGGQLISLSEIGDIDSIVAIAQPLIFMPVPQEEATAIIGPILIDGGTYYPWSPTGPNISWQHMIGGAWDAFSFIGGEFKGVHKPSFASLGSEPSDVSGQPGRYVRCYIETGDLGWKKYQRDIATFATAAVKDPTHAAGMPTPLVPAKFKDLKISYETTLKGATRVESWSGWRHTVKPSNSTVMWRPFRKDVDANESTGMVAFGLDIAQSAAGSSVSIYVELDSASPCGATDEVPGGWEWWDGDQWRELLVADGTSRLRESGLVRFVAPSDWAEGCEDLTADRGRWFRYVTSSPLRLGVIRAAIPDAVLAEYVSAAPDPSQDTSSTTALPAGTIKGLLAPIPGVKKVTNLASVRGRGPESDVDYGRRASAVARHRNRAITAWDYEQMVALQFPEVAAVRCLPHTDSQGHKKPGRVGLVIIPDQPNVLRPRPSVSLAGRITDALSPLMPVGARVATLCPKYHPVTIVATIDLRRGVAAITGKKAVTAALELLLHPTGTSPTRWGVDLYASTLIAAIENMWEVDSVQSFAMRDKTGAVTEIISVDACRGLYCSSGEHLLTWQEQL